MFKTSLELIDQIKVWSPSNGIEIATRAMIKRATMERRESVSDEKKETSMRIEEKPMQAFQLNPLNELEPLR